MTAPKHRVAQSFEWVARNIDATLALVAAVVIAILGLANVTDARLVSTATLFVLAALTEVNLRDRWRRRRDEREAAEVLRQATLAMSHLPPRLDALDRVVADVGAKVAAMSSVRVLDAAEVGPALAEARRNTDTWMFKGGTGTFVRAVTLPECVADSREKRRGLTVRLEIIDPSSEVVCDRYARFRRSLSTGPDGTGQVWTAERARKQAYATIFAACWHRQHHNLLDVEVGLSANMTTFRVDLSASCVIITQEDPRGPGMLVERDQFYYHRWKTELVESLRQARRVPLEQASTVTLGEEPTVDEARRLFVGLGLPLPRSFSDRDVVEVIGKAIRAKNPYES